MFLLVAVLVSAVAVKCYFRLGQGWCGPGQAGELWAGRGVTTDNITSLQSNTNNHFYMFYEKSVGQTYYLQKFEEIF